MLIISFVDYFFYQQCNVIWMSRNLSNLLWCQYILPTIYYDAANVNGCPLKGRNMKGQRADIKTEKDKCGKKSGNIFLNCFNLWISLSSLNALLKASWSKFVFDFEKFNIPSNFYWFTKEKQRVKWKIETWNVILQLTKIKCAVKVIQQMTKYNLL